VVTPARVQAPVTKHIGFLSFGHWSNSPGSQTRSASDALLQSVDLAQAAEDLGADGAYFRVHHFARQLASPFPLCTFSRFAASLALIRFSRTSIVHCPTLGSNVRIK
jgi:alkanesulfonate monooxygenase SsuD/methylene tetrahydromethanopterin reductase-like flavin-dependent oxidoreductase (luciferase family)